MTGAGLDAQPPAPVPPPRRPTCARCLRPVVVCFCVHITALPTRTRIVVLQHPRESRMGIGTARMAHLSLPNSVLRVGLDFSTDEIVMAELRAAGAAAHVLFPGAQARDVGALPAGQSLTLIVLDGTWGEARKLLRLTPGLADLPRVAFAPEQPSAYQIRRQPAPFCVSTIEALAAVLGRVESDAPGAPGEPNRFTRLLDPFHAMVARQKRFESEVHSMRHHRRGPARTPKRPSLAARLTADWPRLVCIQGEANAWPARAADRREPEIVHWVAHRPSTGETLDCVIAPRDVLAPYTPQHVELTAETLRAGMTTALWHAAWSRFTQPNDVLVHWGHFYCKLATQEGLTLPARALELRAEVSQMLRARVGTLPQCVARLQITPPDLGVPGRGGRRLADLAALLGTLSAGGRGAADQ